MGDSVPLLLGPAWCDLSHTLEDTHLSELDIDHHVAVPGRNENGEPLNSCALCKSPYIKVPMLIEVRIPITDAIAD